MCERHNEVNNKLGKPLFPCTINRIEEKWLKGHVNCWNNITNTDDFSQIEEDDLEQQTKDDLALSIIASSMEISSKNNNEDHSSIHVK